MAYFILGVGYVTEELVITYGGALGSLYPSLRADVIRRLSSYSGLYLEYRSTVHFERQERK